MTEPLEDVVIRPKTSPRWHRRLPLVVLALATLAAALFLRGQISFETLREHHSALVEFRDAYYVWAMVVFVLAYLVIVLLSLPAAVMASMTGGFLFGLFPGGLLNLTSATLGALLVFLAVRAGFGEGLRKRIDASEGRVQRLSVALRKNEVPMLIALRLLPIMPFFMVNLMAALFGVATLRFAWTTMIGIIPGGLVYTWVGVGLAEVFARDETPNFGIIFEPHILGPILGLVVLALLPVVLRPYFGASRWS
jgi:uncharacterized membrane protein YdjX (TVP38/TMEM64 family)